MSETVNRATYPRVSDILSPWSADSFKNISVEILQNAAERGTAVHAFCTGFIRDDFLPQPKEEVSAYVESFKQWWGELKHPFLLLSERRLYDDQKMFSGQADIIYEENHKVYLADIKTSASFSPMWPIQLAAYCHLAFLHGYEIAGAKIVHVRCKKTWANEEKTIRNYEPASFKLFEYSAKEMKEYLNKYFIPALDWYNLLKRKK